MKRKVFSAHCDNANARVASVVIFELVEGKSQTYRVDSYHARENLVKGVTLNIASDNCSKAKRA